MDDEATYYVTVGEHTIGPATMSQVLAAIRSGKVSAKDEVCRVGDIDWIPVYRVPSFAAALAVSAPTSAESQGFEGRESEPAPEPAHAGTPPVKVPAEAPTRTSIGTPGETKPDRVRSARRRLVVGVITLATAAACITVAVLRSRALNDARSRVASSHDQWRSLVAARNLEVASLDEAIVQSERDWAEGLRAREGVLSTTAERSAWTRYQQAIRDVNRWAPPGALAEVEEEAGLYSCARVGLAPQSEHNLQLTADLLCPRMWDNYHQHAERPLDEVRGLDMYFRSIALCCAHIRFDAALHTARLLESTPRVTAIREAERTLRGVVGAAASSRSRRESVLAESSNNLQQAATQHQIAQAECRSTHEAWFATPECGPDIAEAVPAATAGSTTAIPLELPDGPIPDSVLTASPEPPRPTAEAEPSACSWRVRDPRPPTRVRPNAGDTTAAVAELANGTAINVVGRDRRWLEIDHPVAGWVFEANVECR